MQQAALKRRFFAGCPVLVLVGASTGAMARDNEDASPDPNNPGTSGEPAEPTDSGGTYTGETIDVTRKLPPDEPPPTPPKAPAPDPRADRPAAEGTKETGGGGSGETKTRAPQNKTPAAPKRPIVSTPCIQIEVQGGTRMCATPRISCPPGQAVGQYTHPDGGKEQICVPDGPRSPTFKDVAGKIWRMIQQLRGPEPQHHEPTVIIGNRG